MICGGTALCGLRPASSLKRAAGFGRQFKNCSPSAALKRAALTRAVPPLPLRESRLGKSRRQKIGRLLREQIGRGRVPLRESRLGRSRHQEIGWLLREQIGRGAFPLRESRLGRSRHQEIGWPLREQIGRGRSLLRGSSPCKIKLKPGIAIYFAGHFGYNTCVPKGDK